jgi:ACS family allantoate permease-like MFS transporter
MDEAGHTLCFMTFHILKRYLPSLNIFIWAVALCCHAACKNFAGLFAVRFILGMCEGSITAGFMIVSSMFYTRREHTTRVGYWCKDRDQLLSTPYLTL